MAERYFNREQEDHMRHLGTIPREQRCASGWHVTAQEPCNCKPLSYNVIDRVTGCTVNAKCPGCQSCW